MTLVDVMSRFSDDDCCRDLLERLRWPTAVKCIRCGSEVARLGERLFQCAKCPYQFSVLTGTIFGDTKLPLETWFLAVLLICEAKKGISAHQLKRTIGVSYKTAWYLCHRIRFAMATAERLPLSGTVELDETYVGGVERGGKRGRGTDKDIVLGIRQRGGDLRFFHVEDVKSGTLAKYVQENVSGNVEVIVTDDSSSYPRALDDAAPPLFGNMRSKHKTIKHSAGVYVEGDVHTNTVESAFSLLKRGIVGSWHKVSAKHLARYLAEMEFRFNRRKGYDLFTETLRHMVNCDPLSFRELVR